MNVSITARHFKARPDLKLFINEKIDRMKTFHDGIIDVEVIMSYEAETQIAEIKTHLKNHKTIVINEKSNGMFKSIELAMDRVMRQLKKEKGKLKGINRRKIVDRLKDNQESESDYV